MRGKEKARRSLQAGRADRSTSSVDMESISKDFERGTFWMAVIVVLAFGLMMIGDAIWNL